MQMQIDFIDQDNATAIEQGLFARTGVGQVVEQFSDPGDEGAVTVGKLGQR